MMSRALMVATFGIAVLAISSPLLAQHPGSIAAMHVGVGEDMQVVDMAEFIDGTPLVFVYGSAT